MAEIKAAVPEWMKAIAITTTVLAVVAAIASSRSSFYVAKAQVLTALEGDQWGHYQAKSIKEYIFDTQRQNFEYALIGATTPEQRDYLNKTIAEYDKDKVHYEQDKADIQKEAEATSKENGLVIRRGSQFSLAVVFAQIGIMLSGVGTLLKRKDLWIVGVVAGVVSLIFMANGFLLFF